MSKHNNNLSKSLEKKCYCGRQISLGELKAGFGVSFKYVCPECNYRQNTQRFFAQNN